MRQIASYEHNDKDRPNNPPAGLVSPQSDPDGPAKAYAYDPHLDPQLVWAGKAEHTSFAVPTVSLHVHERIDPRTILDAARRAPDPGAATQLSLFGAARENPPLRQAIEFYRHRHGWSNRLIAGDSLLVMNSLLEKEGLAGQVQMVYIDPPYGIKYGSNFQPFVNKRDVKDGKDDDLSSEPEQIRAFRDTWELGIHSYLSYLRDRILLSRELLTETGSIFVQISDDNIHLVRLILDGVFGKGNFVRQIAFKKTGYLASTVASSNYDFLLWYAKDRTHMRFRALHIGKESGGSFVGQRLFIDDDGNRRPATPEENEAFATLQGVRVYRTKALQGSGTSGNTEAYAFEEVSYSPAAHKHWLTSPEGLRKLHAANRLQPAGSSLEFVWYYDDFPLTPLSVVWEDTVTSGFGRKQAYVVETNPIVLQRCILMTTNPGDIVLDPTCGSGTTAEVAEQWGRRWITCDTSRVAVTLAKQRLMTAAFDYYELARPEEGVGSGFRYRTVPHVTLKSIANNPDIREGLSRAQIDAAIARHAPQETLYDQPFVDKSKARVTGPFTVEAVPAPVVKPLEEVDSRQLSGAGEEGDRRPPTADRGIARSGETLRQAEWRDELFRAGIRGKGGQRIAFARLEPLPGTRYLHAEGETRPDAAGSATVRESGPEYATAASPQRVVVSFGPEHAPLEQRQVESALFEAEQLRPKPRLLVFAAFQFDPEAAKDIDETNWPGVTLLKAQMAPDLFTDDLKKKRAGNESFWLIGQPDVEVEPAAGGQYRVSVHGFDYFNTRTGEIESGGSDKIAMWLLDTDYDGRSLFPRQVFFPMAGDKEGWARLARNLKAEIDDELIEAYRGTVSLPFAAGPHRRAAVKIIDDRGIESLKIVELG